MGRLPRTPKEVLNMPTISIRTHGVSATRNQTVVNPDTGEIVKLAAFNQPERTATKGWTANVARRNEQRLQQIDFEGIEGFPAFVTLTMPAQQMGDVSAAMFHGWLKRWLQFMKRHGMLHYYWILEFQASGNPPHPRAGLARPRAGAAGNLQGSEIVGRHSGQVRRRRATSRADLGEHRHRR